MSSYPYHNDTNILFEGTQGTPEFWKEKLGASNEEIAFLQGQLILRKLSGNSENQSFRLDFVGLICLRNSAFFSLPKIYKAFSGNFIQAMQRTLGCLQRYHGRGPRSRTFQSAQAGAGGMFDSAGTIVDMFLSFLDWTREHDFHQSDEAFRYDEYSHISWRDTLRHRFPVHFGHSVVYGDPVGYRMQPMHNELAELQALAIIELSDRLGLLSTVWFQDYDPVRLRAMEILAEPTLFIKDRNEVRQIVDRYAFSANKDSDRSLLDLLSLWLDSDYKRSTQVQLYGTNAFHVIWEDMCACLFKNFGQLLRHSDLASQPYYMNDRKMISIGPQRPDILVEVDGELQIADAKWYDFDGGDLPHLEDVVKQIVYQMTISPDQSVKNNLFLVPGLDGTSWDSAGHFRMRTDKIDDRFPSIQVIRLNWDEVADSYTLSFIPKWRNDFIQSISHSQNG